MSNDATYSVKTLPFFFFILTMDADWATYILKDRDSLILVLLLELLLFPVVVMFRRLKTYGDHFCACQHLENIFGCNVLTLNE